MIDIDNYLNDGANYKTQMILCYLRGNQYEIKEKCYLEGEDLFFSMNHIIVGRFENCREQGYVFGVQVRGWIELVDKWMVVEHRSGDSIKVRHFRTHSINTPSIGMAYNDDILVEEKWFDYNEVMECAEYILNSMGKCVDDYMESPMFKKVVEKHEEKFGKNSLS